MSRESSSAQQLQALWDYTLRYPRNSSQPFVGIIGLGALWILVSLCGELGKTSAWLGLIILGVYSVWALALYAYLRQLSHEKTARSKQRTALLHLLNSGVSLLSMSGLMLVGGLQLIKVEVFWKTLLLGSYAATLVLAALFSYHWLILPAARRLSGGNGSSGLSWARVAGLATPASAAALGVVAGRALSRTVAPGLTLLVAGGVLTVVAFVLAALGAGLLCETYMFARSEASRSG